MSRLQGDELSHTITLLSWFQYTKLSWFQYMKLQLGEPLFQH